MDFHSNPEVILSKDCELEKLAFYGNKCLGDPIVGIDLTEVTDIFCKGESDRQDLLSNKLSTLSNKSGFIHVSNGTSYTVINGIITAIKLRRMSLGKLSFFD